MGKVISCYNVRFLLLYFLSCLNIWIQCIISESFRDDKEFIDTHYQWQFLCMAYIPAIKRFTYVIHLKTWELDLFPYLPSDLLFFVILSLILGYSDHENEHYSGVTVRQTEHSPLSLSMYDERQNILHFMSSVSILNNMDTNYIQ